MELISRITAEDFPADVRAFLGDNSWISSSPTLVFELASKRANVRTLFDSNGTQYFVAADLKGIGIDVAMTMRQRDGDSQKSYYEQGFHWVYAEELVQPTNPNLQPQTRLLTREGLYQLIVRSKHAGISELQKRLLRWFAALSSATMNSMRRLHQEEIQALDDLNKAQSQQIAREITENKLLRDRLSAYERSKILKLGQLVESLSEELTDTKLELSKTKAALRKAQQIGAINTKKGVPSLDVGPCFYVVHNTRETVPSYKFGITDNINNRLRTYRCGMPCLEIVYLVNLKKPKIIEDIVKCKYEEFISPPGSEVMIHPNVSYLISSVRQALPLLGIETKEASPEMIDRYNEWSIKRST